MHFDSQMAPSDSTPYRALRSRVLSAGSWSLAALIVSQGLRFLGNLVMTRLLIPEMFGIMLIVTTVSVVLALLSDIGLHQNIVQSRRGEAPVFLNTAWTVQIVRGFVLYAMTALVATAIWVGQNSALFPPGSTYAAQELPLILAVAGLSSILHGFQSTKVATAFRTFQQRKIVLSELIAQIVALVSMLAIGYVTHSIWALVIAGLVATALNTLLSHCWLAGCSNRLQWDSASLRELLHFGRWIFLSSFVGILAVNGDRIIFGAAMPAYEMGLYSIALLLLGALELAIHRVAAAVVLPALSEVAREGNQEKFRATYYRFRCVLDVALLFLCGFLVATGPAIILLIYDERYARAGEMLSVLAVGIFFWRFYITHQAWLALGKTNYLALDSFARLVSLWMIVPLCLVVDRLDWAIWAVAVYPLPTLVFIGVANRRLGLISGTREVIFLPLVGIGYLVGRFLIG